jgi:hypothetical protein
MAAGVLVPMPREVKCIPVLASALCAPDEPWLRTDMGEVDKYRGRRIIRTVAA